MRWKHNNPVKFVSNVTKSSGLSNVACLRLEAGEQTAETRVVACLAGRDQVLLSVGPAVATGQDVGCEQGVARPAVAAAPPVALEDPPSCLGPGGLVSPSSNRTRSLDLSSFAAAVWTVGVPPHVRLRSKALAARRARALHVTWLNGLA